MSAHLSSIMLKSAARKVSTLAVSRGAWKASVGAKNLPCSVLATNSALRTFGSRGSDLDDFGIYSDVHNINHMVEPLPAVAYDYVDDDDDEHDHTAVVQQENPEKITSSSAGGRITNAPPRSTSASLEGRSLPSRKSGSSGGGGNDGRHRCPKCGTSVTFRHGDFEENTYYCATCSGWFLIDNNNVISDKSKQGSDSSYQEYVAKNGSDGTKPQDPQILMQHVSSCRCCSPVMLFCRIVSHHIII